MLTIELKNVKMFGHHGITREEKAKGGMYEINMSVKIKEVKETIIDILDTVNYEVLLDIVKERMNEQSDLLETIAMDIARRTKERYFQVKEISIQIIKLDAPIKDLNGQVAVTCVRNY